MCRLDGFLRCLFALLVTVSVFLSCRGPEKPQEAIPSVEALLQASLNSVGVAAERDKVQNLIAIADCLSPKGSYQTITHSARGGYTYFKQVFSFSPEAYEAVIQNKTTGIQLGDSSAVLSPAERAIVRGHEFHFILLELKTRFHSFAQVKALVNDSVNCYVLNAQDEWNKPVSLYFDQENMRLLELEIRNPEDPEQRIRTHFLNWKQQDGLFLPFLVEIEQGGRKYRLNYQQLLINAPGFAYQKIN